MITAGNKGRYVDAFFPHPFHGVVDHCGVPGLRILVETHSLIHIARYCPYIVSAYHGCLIFAARFSYKGCPIGGVYSHDVFLQVAAFLARELHGIKLLQATGHFSHLVYLSLVLIPVKLFPDGILEPVHFPEKSGQLDGFIYRDILREVYEIMVSVRFHAVFFGEVHKVRVKGPLRYLVLLEGQGLQDQFLQFILFHLSAQFIYKPAPF